jgi:hypothetical protein
MKKLVLLVVLLSCTMLAQSTPETLQIGFVPLHLGMAKTEVLSMLQKAGYKFDDEHGIVTEKTPRYPYSTLGAIGFEGDELSFINRTWTPDAATAHAVATSVFGVFRELERRGRTTCAIETSDQMGPTAEIRAVTIQCRPGKSFVTIGAVHTAAGDSIMIDETLRK